MPSRGASTTYRGPEESDAGSPVFGTRPAPTPRQQARIDELFREAWSALPAEFFEEVPA